MLNNAASAPKSNMLLFIEELEFYLKSAHIKYTVHVLPNVNSVLLLLESHQLGGQLQFYYSYSPSLKGVS